MAPYISSCTWCVRVVCDDLPCPDGVIFLSLADDLHALAMWPFPPHLLHSTSLKRHCCRVWFPSAMKTWLTEVLLRRCGLSRVCLALTNAVSRRHRLVSLPELTGAVLSCFQSSSVFHGIGKVAIFFEKFLLHRHALQSPNKLIPQSFGKVCTETTS